MQRNISNKLKLVKVSVCIWVNSDLAFLKIVSCPSCDLYSLLLALFYIWYQNLPYNYTTALVKFKLSINKNI